MVNALLDIVHRNRAGESIAIPSVCTAHPDVLRIVLKFAAAENQPIVIEATSNQVNQEGGYTGMTPGQFVAFVSRLALNAGADPTAIIFGGDHLGPQAWRNLPAEEAMAKADVMIRDYVKAGFCKIHLDCSEGCAGEPAQVDEQTAAQRAARLMSVALNASENPEGLTFVIGTEVPPPGGAKVDSHGDIAATTPESAASTLQAHECAFLDAGLGDVRALVSGLVVQPGVEFGPMTVYHLPLERSFDLRSVMMRWPNLALEAHSTDYQKPEAYPRLAELGFAYQKVGPALTFAWRQAVYALDQTLSFEDGSAPIVSPAMERIMLKDRGAWQSHYHGDPDAQFVQRHLALADRIRYYWPHPDAQAAVQAVLAALESRNLSRALVEQFFPKSTIDRAELGGDLSAATLIAATVEQSLEPYFFRATRLAPPAQERSA